MLPSLAPPVSESFWAVAPSTVVFSVPRLRVVNCPPSIVPATLHTSSPEKTESVMDTVEPPSNVMNDMVAFETTSLNSSDAPLLTVM